MDGGDWLALLAGVGLTVAFIAVTLAVRRPYSGVPRHPRCAGCGLVMQTNDDGTVITHAFDIGQEQVCPGSRQLPLGPQTVTLTFDHDDWEDIERASWEAMVFRARGQAQATMQVFLDQVSAARAAQAPPPPPSRIDDESDSWSPSEDRSPRPDRRHRS